MSLGGYHRHSGTSAGGKDDLNLRGGYFRRFNHRSASATLCGNGSGPSASPSSPSTVAVQQLVAREVDKRLAQC